MLPRCADLQKVNFYVLVRADALCRQLEVGCVVARPEDQHLPAQRRRPSLPLLRRGLLLRGAAGLLAARLAGGSRRRVYRLLLGAAGLLLLLDRAAGRVWGLLLGAAGR